MTVRLDPRAGSLVADEHAAAVRAVDDAAASSPSGVDAGIGTAEVMAVLAAVSRDAADLTVANAALAALVRDVTTDLEATDAVIASRFADLAGGRP